MDFLSMGIMPSTDILNKAGISVNEAQNYISALLSSRTKKSSSGSKSSSSSTKKKTSNESKYDYSDLSDYAKGVYTDILKKGYSPEDIDEAITNQFNKKYITKKEADILAGLLIMEE